MEGLSRDSEMIEPLAGQRFGQSRLYGSLLRFGEGEERRPGISSVIARAVHGVFHAGRAEFAGDLAGSGEQGELKAAGPGGVAGAGSVIQLTEASGR